MVSPGYYPIKGGTEAMVELLSRDLNMIGIHTDIMTFNMDKKWKPKWHGEISKSDGSTVFRIPGLKWLPGWYSNKITMNLNLIPGRFTNIFENYDIIHFHEAEFSFPMFSIFTTKPKILHLHGIEYDYYKKYHLSTFMLKHSAPYYLSITKRIKSQLVDLGVPKERIAYFPNAINTELFKPSDTLKKLDNTLLYVGRIAPAKGLHVLLESLKFIKKSVHLVIIGAKDWDLVYVKNILRLIASHNMIGNHKVTYLGVTNQNDLVKWYQQASIFVLPSIFEPFGIVLLEALSCGTPVISTFADGIPEAVKNGENGILVPVNNPKKLADAVVFLLDNRNIREQFAQAGRKWVINNFSLDATINRLRNVYRQIGE